MQPHDLEQAYRTVRPDILQFHGSETLEWMAMVRKLLGTETWRAIGLRERATLLLGEDWHE